jgi:hypothetical protein
MKIQRVVDITVIYTRHPLASPKCDRRYCYPERVECHIIRGTTIYTPIETATDLPVRPKRSNTLH